MLVATKDVLSAGSTRWAQGGIAAALAPGDRPQDHGADTLAAGAGLCDPAAVRVLVDADARPVLQAAMTAVMGMVRTAEGLDRAAKVTADLCEGPDVAPCTEAWETTNLVTVARVLVAAAQAREETRGSHWRDDHPEADPVAVGHVEHVVDPSGRLHTTFRPEECDDAAE